MKNTVILRDATRGEWLAFRAPVDVIEARTAAEVLPVLRRAEALVNERGLYAAGFVSYEAAPGFDAALPVRTDTSDFPLLWLGLYAEPEVVAAPEAGPPLAGEWAPSVGREAYGAAIAAIKDYIARGDTYQVNYTLRLRRAFAADAWALFRALVPAQQAAYSAYVDIGRYALCSVSPELFFERTGARVTTRPMKGTAARGRWSADDRAQADWLRASEKNQAENVMIVDMARNDLGRVAAVGSVRVPRLFEAEPYPTVWQMTSTVTGESDAPLAELMAALFPSASITGAPKRRTMQIIAGLEDAPRRIYTGAIGYFGPRGRAQFNVAIRTVLVDRAEQTAEYGVGGGIVWDSDTAGEYDEWQQKARVLHEPRPAFALFETLRWSPDGGYWLLDYHLRRLRESAEYFGFTLRAGAAEAELAAAVAGLSGPQRVRLQLEADGRMACGAQPLAPGAAGPVRLVLAAEPVDSGERWLYHKTTRREAYTRARAARPDSDDVLLWNERGELTETTIGNVVARLDARLVTPPLECGLLPGTYRAWLLDQGEVAEQVIPLARLAECELFRVNAVRGWEPAVLMPAAQKSLV
ncbi:MAG: aminodeoxychorismate synthase component I [Anaerolineales bacterium]